jgi:ribosomal protein S27AE
MKVLIPQWVAEALWRLRWMRRPEFLAQSVTETPYPEELRPGVLFYEVRDGHLKWLHLRCPKCRDHIQLPAIGKRRWSLGFDCLRRPTVSPSIWETEACGAHFFIRKGRVVWCPDR